MLIITVSLYVEESSSRPNPTCDLSGSTFGNDHGVTWWDSGARAALPHQTGAQSASRKLQPRTQHRLPLPTPAPSLATHRTFMLTCIPPINASIQRPPYSGSTLSRPLPRPHSGGRGVPRHFSPPSVFTTVLAPPCLPSPGHLGP